MSGTPSALRRAVVLAVVLGAVAAAAAWARRRTQPAHERGGRVAPAEWPPIHRDVVATGAAAVDHQPAPAGWVAAGEGLEPPEGFPVKVKMSSGIFHVPGGRFYDRTNADRFYATADAAEADGYRRSKS
jgi:hypothetical protein